MLISIPDNFSRFFITMSTATRLDITHTELPPCCLRVHPENINIVFLGTYKLEKESGLRHGSIDIYDIDHGRFSKRHSTPTKLAVLDLKINPQDALMLLLAHSTGNLMIWKFDGDGIHLEKNMNLFDELDLITSVFFSPQKASLVLVTLTSGASAIVDLESGNSDELYASHSLECWTGAFGEAGPAQNVVFTGGDDAKLIAHDLRTNEKIWETSHRHHDAGVVLILCPGPKWLSRRPNSLWTGSYDDNLRVFDLRKLDGDEGPILFQGLLPQQQFAENLNGGVWRLIPAPDSDKVLACCMYDGARIIDPTEAPECPEVIRYFKGDHESMCYGGDWQGDFVVTCSFYDNVVQMWLPTEVEKQ